MRVSTIPKQSRIVGVMEELVRIIVPLCLLTARLVDPRNPTFQSIARLTCPRSQSHRGKQ